MDGWGRDAGYAQIQFADRPPLRALAGQTVLAALQSAGVDLRQAVIAIANGSTVDLDYQLQAGDVVRLIPQIAGG